jgi:rare lipoprotein A
METSGSTGEALVRRCTRMGLAGLIGLLVANCASQPTQYSRSSTSKEVGAFSDSRKYGRASPRMVADGTEVPKGGGKYHVGNPYRIAGRTYYPSDRPVGHSQSGMASWYGEAFHGRKTANGEIYDRRSYTAAHPTMPIPSYARVTNLRNSHSIIVRVNDRGPYHGGRVMDVSERVANALDFKHTGTTRVRIDYLGKAGLAGSDDVRLAASLRTDGQPASSPGVPASQGAVQVASSEPVQMQVPATPRPSAAALVPASRPAAPMTPAPSVESDDEATPAPVLAYQPTRATPARGIPMPPNRPFDLGTIPGAATPVRAGDAAPAIAPPPTRTAGLSFAPEASGTSRFMQDNPLAKLPPAKFTRTVRPAAIN